MSVTRRVRWAAVALFVLCAPGRAQEPPGGAPPMDCLVIELKFGESGVELGQVEHRTIPLQPYPGVAEANPLYYEVTDDEGSAVAKGPLRDPRRSYDAPDTKTGTTEIAVPAQRSRRLSVYQHSDDKPEARTTLLDGAALP